MRQLLEAERHGHLVAPCRADKAVYLVEVQRGQLVHDDAHRDVPLGVHTGYQAVQHEGVERADDLFFLRVVGNDKIARMLPVGNLQVEVVPGEHPVGLRRHEPCGVDAERAHHSFQLVVGLVLIGTLERRHERSNLVVLHQDVEHLVVWPAQKREHVRHIRIFPRNGVWFHHVAVLVLIPAAVDTYQFPCAVFIAVTVQVHEHPIFVCGNIVALLVHEIQHHVPVLVYGVEVVPIPDDYFQLLSLV